MKTYTLVLGKLSLTFAEISQRHIWRISNEAPGEPAPKTPDGYTHEQALENLPEYKELFNRHTNRIIIESMEKTVGASRLIAAENGLISDDEHTRLSSVCLLYSLPDPDKQATPLKAGDAVWDISEELDPGHGIERLTEVSYWLNATAGGVDSKLIEEAIKSLRRESERVAVGPSVQGSESNSASGESRTDNNRKRGVRSGGRRKGVGAPVA